MPQVGWILGDEEVSIEEALEIAEREGSWYGWVPAALRAMHNTREDGEWLSPSQADNCARQRVLKAEHPYYVDPQRAWLPFMGTAIHMALAHADRNVEDVDTEIHLSATLKVPVDGELVEVTIAGTADRINHTYKRITDYKGVASFKYYSKQLKRQMNREIPSPSHEIQANIYKWLAEQNGYQIDEVDIWYVRMERSATRKLVKVDTWDPEDAALVVAEYAQTIARQIVTKELPMAEFLDPGHEKHWLCGLCPVREYCERALREEPTP